jgi:hypothetical protein
MERLTRALVIIVLFVCTPAGAQQLRRLGASLALSELARGAPQAAASEAPLAFVRSVSAQMRGTPLKLAQAPAPYFALPPATTPASAPSHVGADAGAGPTLRNFDGMAPGTPGVSGAVGEQQYVQLAGGFMAVYRKLDGAVQAGPVGTHALFAGAGNDACAAPHASAGAVHYDHLARRWIVAHLAGAPGQAVQCIAVSRTADATGPYHRYALHLAGAEAVHAEDARMAVWPDAYFVSVTLFANAGGHYRGPRVCALERLALLAGRHAALRCVDPGRAFGPVAVAGLEGESQPPAGTPAMLVALDSGEEGGARLLLWRFPVAGAGLGAPLAIPVAPYLNACDGACLAQPHPGAALFALGDRLLPRVAYRHTIGTEASGTEASGSQASGRAAMVLAHAVRLADGRTGVRWYELRDPLHAPRVYQQGTHAPDGEHRAMASIGIDRAGNIALGYGVAGAATPPGVRYAGRRRSDAPGRMQAEQFVVNGTGVQAHAAGALPASGALSLDPIDDCTFWYTQHYVAVTGERPWRTRIASFKFADCR